MPVTSRDVPHFKGGQGMKNARAAAKQAYSGQPRIGCLSFSTSVTPVTVPPHTPLYFCRVLVEKASANCT